MNRPIWLVKADILDGKRGMAAGKEQWRSLSVLRLPSQQARGFPTSRRFLFGREVLLPLYNHVHALLTGRESSRHKINAL